MRKNNRGSALGMVMILGMILLFMVTSAMMLTSGYHARSVKANAKQQMYLTSQSLAEAIAADFLNTGAGNSPLTEMITNQMIAQGLTADSTEPVTLPNIQIDGLDENKMGHCDVSAVYNPVNRQMDITVAAAKAGETNQTTVSLKNEVAGKVSGIFDGIKTGAWLASNLIGTIQNSGCDVWITGAGAVDIRKDILPYHVNSSRNMGTLYSRGSIMQSYAVDGGFLGRVITDGSIDLSQKDNQFTINTSNKRVMGINPEDNVYSLYASGISEPEPSKGMIHLAGAIKLDSEPEPELVLGEEKKRMKATSILLEGPAYGEGMEINGQLEALKDITIGGGVYQTGAVCSGGAVSIGGESISGNITIGVENDESSIDAGSITIRNQTASGEVPSGKVIQTWGNLTAGMPGDGTILIEGDSPVLVNGNLQASGDMTIKGLSQENPIVINGDLISASSITLSGNVTVTGNVVSPDVVLEYKGTLENSQVLIKGDICTRNIEVTAHIEDDGKADDDGLLQTGIRINGSIFVDGDIPDVLYAIEVRDNLCFHYGSEALPEDELKHMMDGEDGTPGLKDGFGITGEQLISWETTGSEKTAVNKAQQKLNWIEKAVNIKIRELTLQSRMPQEEEMLNLGYRISQVKAEDTINVSNYQLSNTGEFVYSFSLADTESAVSVDATLSQADTYLIAPPVFKLSGLKSRAGIAGSPNAYLFIDGSEVEISGEADAYVFGETGKLKISPNGGGSLKGICNVGILETGPDAEITYVQRNPDAASVFTNNWKLLRYYR